MRDITLSFNFFKSYFVGILIKHFFYYCVKMKELVIRFPIILIIIFHHLHSKLGIRLMFLIYSKPQVQYIVTTIYSIMFWSMILLQFSNFQTNHAEYLCILRQNSNLWGIINDHKVTQNFFEIWNRNCKFHS